MRPLGLSNIAHAASSSRLDGRDPDMAGGEIDGC